MSTIRTRPATAEYRKNFPFPDKSDVAVDQPPTVTRNERTFIVAPTLLEARQRYMSRLGNGGYINRESAETGRTDKHDEIWQIDLHIECVRR